MTRMVVRPALLDDAETLLRWRNDPGTVEHSVVPDPVDPEWHAAWLRSTLYSRDRYLAVVEQGGVLVATFRLDHLGSPDVEVSLTVAPEARGRGLAAGVISYAVHLARTRWSYTTQRIVARVHERNVRSRRAFMRAGFSLRGDPEGSGEAVFLTYVLEVSKSREKIS